MNLRLTAPYLALTILFSLAPIHLAVAAPAALTDPKPPQVTASFIYPPGPLIQYGTAVCRQNLLDKLVKESRESLAHRS